MNRAEKILKDMRNNPRDWRISQVETLASHYGFSIRRPGSGGSHVILRHPSGGKLSIPARRPIKPIYIKRLVQMIERLEE